MFRSTSAAASLVVCTTCRVSADQREDGKGRRGGEIFADHLGQALAGHPCQDRLEIQSMPCLFACNSQCTAFLRSGGRLGYILGKFAPTSESATALLDFAAQYLASADGVVPYANWPEGVKGHFLARVPPEGLVWHPSSPPRAALQEHPEGEAN